MSADFWASIEDQLAELNEQATAVLDHTTPAPDGLPPRGSWIRAMKVDDDAHAKPASPWHYVAGWDSWVGCLSTRCCRCPRGNINSALAHYLGETSKYRHRRWDRLTLVIAAERPPEGACGQCDISLAREAARAVAAVEAAEIERVADLLPAIRSIAGDSAIDDAERGRRLRDLWPQ
jgi:hypothetical protein